MTEEICKIIEARIEHPFYPSMDFNKLNKKKITMTMEKIVNERKNILREILNEIKKLKPKQKNKKC